MKTVALCKTFRGEEFIIPMALAIYPYVDKIVFVNSEIGWNGRQGNKCKPSIQYMIENLDPDGKIVSLNYDTIDQLDQCWYGYKWIQDNLESDHVMFVDTDEIWDDHDLKVALNLIEMNPEYDFYRTGLYTYIKSPLFRVDPIEPLKPVSFVKSNLDDLGEHARCCDEKFKGRTLLLKDSGDDNQSIFYHHYVYVRNDFNTVLEKIVTSHVSEHRNYQDTSVWIPEVWNKIDEGFEGFDGIWEGGFHPAIGFRHNWQKLKQIKVSEMPRVLREGNYPILEKYGVVN